MHKNTKNLLALIAAGFLLAGCAHHKPVPGEAAAATGPASMSPSPKEIAAIIASPDRREADRANDLRRKPERLMPFIGINRGMTALDLFAGAGYTSELLARIIGPTGKVYAQLAPRGDAPPPNFAVLEQRAAGLTSGRIIPVLRKLDDPIPPEIAKGGADLATLMFNYHDLGHLGVDRAKFNKAVFDALKPGSMYIIADHSGRPGTGISESGTLHRIEEALVRKEVQAAGFRFIESGDFLRNPNDPRDKKDPDGGIPKDEFVLKFVKP